MIGPHIRAGSVASAGWTVPAGACGGRVVIVDFDGTITERDTLDLVVERFGRPEVRRAVEVELGQGRLTVNEAIARQYATLAEPLATVSGWLVEHSPFRAGVGELVRLAERRAWPLRIVSSGLRELIEPLLAREGLSHLPLISNSLVAPPPPWLVRLDEEHPCEVCGEACKRGRVMALAASSEAVYVGDGLSDACAAKAADLVFARRRLAARFDELGLDYEPFEDFFSITSRLDA